jgi:hypothetical protein
MAKSLSEAEMGLLPLTVTTTGPTTAVEMGYSGIMGAIPRSCEAVVPVEGGSPRHIDDILTGQVNYYALMQKQSGMNGHAGVEDDDEDPMNATNKKINRRGKLSDSEMCESVTIIDFDDEDESKGKEARHEYFLQSHFKLIIIVLMICTVMIVASVEMWLSQSLHLDVTASRVKRTVSLLFARDHNQL